MKIHKITSIIFLFLNLTIKASSESDWGPPGKGPNKLPTLNKFYEIDELNNFVLKNNIHNFRIALRRNKVKITDDFGLRSIISVQDLLQADLEKKGYTGNCVERLCNGDYFTKDSSPPLYYAIVVHRNIEFAQVLLESGANPSIFDNNESETPLDFATRTDQREKIDLLLQHGAQPARIQTINKLVSDGLLYNKAKLKLFFKRKIN